MSTAPKTRDPAITRDVDLAPLLDTETLARAISRAGVDPHGRVAIMRVHFSDKRPTVLQLELGGAQRLLAEVIGSGAGTHAETEGDRLAKSRRAQIGKAECSPIAADADSGLVFRPPGFDARLPGLRLLRDPQAASGLMARATGADPGAVQVDLVAHRLGKRAVLRMKGADGRRCYVRLGAAQNDNARHLHDRHIRIAGSLCGRQDITVPKPLRFDAELQAAVYSALPGRPPSLQGVDGFRDTHATIKALDALHGLDAVALRSHGPAEEHAILTDWRDRVEMLRPAWRNALAQGFERVSRELGALSDAVAGFCHRDFHEGQVLISEDLAGIMDFDTAVRGDPMIDVGNLIAHYHLHGIRTGLMVAPFEQAAEMGPCFDRSAEDCARVMIWRRATILRLACIYALTSEPRSVVDALFAEAAG